MVNPPQKPTARRSFSLGDSHWLSAEMPYRMPMIRHPRILMENVSQGNAEGLMFDLISLPTRYLAAPPVPLPRNTANMLIKVSIMLDRIWLCKGN